MRGLRDQDFRRRDLPILLAVGGVRPTHSEKRKNKKKRERLAAHPDIGESRWLLLHSTLDRVRRRARLGMAMSRRIRVLGRWYGAWSVDRVCIGIRSSGLSITAPAYRAHEVHNSASSNHAR